MDLSDKRKAGVCLVVLFSLSALALAATAPPLVNWTAAPTYAPHRDARIRALSDISNPVPFIAIAPCRQYNSLLATPLLQAVNRAVTLTGAPCGIPASAVAVSVNITVFNITGATGNGVFKVDTVSPPAVAWINYPPSETQRANAGAVALNGSGQIIVQVAQGAGQIDFIVDVNGYYGGTPGTPQNVFTILNNSSLYSIFAQNSSTTCTAGCGIVGHILSTSGGYAVAGYSDGTTLLGSLSAGVYGKDSDSFGSGVRGDSHDAPFTGSGANLLWAGVRGDSRDGHGVLGVSERNGVTGYLMASGSTTVTARGILAAFFGTALDTTTGPWGVFAEGTLGATGAKHFVEPHPRDPKKVILYSSIEGRTVDTYFRGTARFVDHEAVIEVPEDFRIVTDENGLTVQLTPVGGFASMYVESQDLNRIVVKSSRDVEFHYLIQGLRRAFKDFQPVQTGYEFMPASADARLPGYLTEEAKRRLIENGTYNEDGTVNMATAERAGFAKIWADRAAAIQATSQETHKAFKANQAE